MQIWTLISIQMFWFLRNIQNVPLIEMHLSWEAYASDSISFTVKVNFAIDYMFCLFVCFGKKYDFYRPNGIAERFTQS